MGLNFAPALPGIIERVLGIRDGDVAEDRLGTADQWNGRSDVQP